MARRPKDSQSQQLPADKEFSPEETQHRFEAALRGARISGHRPMAEISPKRTAVQRKRKKRD